MQNKRTDEARAYYQRVLSLDPNDPTATAAMATFSAETDSAGAESRLIRAYQADPSAETASALGSLFAHQQRWREAQDYYFRAYSASPDEPDYAFNLAVSLDALGQRALAADYYSRALSMGANRAANFDQEAAKRRLSELKGS
jgi:Flp pilus assembly protein TadD